MSGEIVATASQSGASGDRKAGRLWLGAYMTLKTCKECGGPLSSAATSCPKCGWKQPKPTSLGTWIFGGLFAAFVATCTMTSIEGTQKASEREAITAAADAALTPEQKAQNAAEKARKHAEENSVLVGAAQLRASMKKPEAFELVDAFVTDKGALCYRYRGRNSWNDVRDEYFVIGPKGGSNRNKDWNALCPGSTYTDYTAYTKAFLRDMPKVGMP